MVIGAPNVIPDRDNVGRFELTVDWQQVLEDPSCELNSSVGSRRSWLRWNAWMRSEEVCTAL